MDHNDLTSASPATGRLAWMGDQKLLERMVPHHMMAVQLAQSAEIDHMQLRRQ